MKEKFKKITFKFIMSSIVTSFTSSFGIISLYYTITEFKAILKDEHILFIPFVILISLSMIITSFIAQYSIVKKD